MGKVTGFMEYERIEEGHESVKARLGHYKEFVIGLDDAQASMQGARCMDCGTPFCNNACPLNNVIPDFNDLVYRKAWRGAWRVLSSTNNFPEFTGRICPAPCEAACVLNINSDAVGIKSIEHAIIDHAWAQGWITPQPPQQRSGKRVAVVGSGPSGMAAAQQLARVGHDVTLFDKNDRAGGLLRYGIPDFKLDKMLIDRRIEQMVAEGVKLRLGVRIGDLPKKGPGSAINDFSSETLTPSQLLADFDAILLTGGCEQSRDLPVPGRDLEGIHFAMDWLPQQNRINAGDRIQNAISAHGKHVIVIGGGDTGSDCVGTSNRHGAKSVTQLEVMPMPPEVENKPLTWPYWPLKLRTSSSHEEGAVREFSISTQSFIGQGGKVKALRTVGVSFKGGKPVETPGSEKDWPADLVLLAMGFTNPAATLLDAFAVEKDARGNAKASADPVGGYASSAPRVFVAGDMRRGQSLVVWAIREGRLAARAIDTFLMGRSTLPS